MCLISCYFCSRNDLVDDYCCPDKVVKKTGSALHESRLELYDKYMPQLDASFPYPYPIPRKRFTAAQNEASELLYECGIRWVLNDCCKPVVRNW